MAGDLWPSILVENCTGSRPKGVIRQLWPRLSLHLSATRTCSGGKRRRWNIIGGNNVEVLVGYCVLVFTTFCNFMCLFLVVFVLPLYLSFYLHGLVFFSPSFQGYRPCHIMSCVPMSCVIFRLKWLWFSVSVSVSVSITTISLLTR